MVNKKPYEDRTMREILTTARDELLASDNMTEAENAKRTEEIWEEVDEMKEQLKKKWPKPMIVAVIIAFVLFIFAIMLPFIAPPV